MRSSVVLPHPLGPRSTKNSPSATVRSTSLTAATRPRSKDLVTPRTTMSAIPWVLPYLAPALDTEAEYVAAHDEDERERRDHQQPRRGELVGVRRGAERVEDEGGQRRPLNREDEGGDHLVVRHQHGERGGGGEPGEGQRHDHPPERAQLTGAEDLRR